MGSEAGCEASVVCEPRCVVESLFAFSGIGCQLCWQMAAAVQQIFLYFIVFLEYFPPICVVHLISCSVAGS